MTEPLTYRTALVQLRSAYIDGNIALPPGLSDMILNSHYNEVIKYAEMLSLQLTDKKDILTISFINAIDKLKNIAICESCEAECVTEKVHLDYDKKKICVNCYITYCKMVINVSRSRIKELEHQTLKNCGCTVKT